MPRFIISPPAERDISDIALYIARDNPVRARSFAKELRAHIAKIAKQPLAYREREEVQAGLRAAVHRRYLIFFRFDGKIVEVLHVINGSRDLAGLFED